MAYVPIYEEDSEDIQMTDKMNALRMLDEKNKELSDGSNYKKGEGSVNDSLKSSLM